MSEGDKMKNRERIIKTDEEYKIMVDPYRMNIFSIYKDHKEPLTVKMVADIMGEVRSKVHYHVQKLISIDILELDHIEIINGIHAKYYRTTTDWLRFSVREGLGSIATSMQVDQIANVLFETIDKYKQDIVHRFTEAKKTGVESMKDSGYLTLNELYLTPDDYEELLQLITDFANKKEKETPNSKKYSSLFGVIQKFEETK